MSQPTSGAVLIDGRYTIEKRLGAGGMGEVYLAHDGKLDRAVALKVLRAEALGDESGRERLFREARAAARLGHPGIVEVFDVGETAEGDAYLVMERVEGRSLRELLREGPLPLEEVLRVITALADALAAAHREGVIHRDVKPDNAMVRDDGRVVLLDFGIVKRVAAPLDDTASPEMPTLQGLTKSGAIVGTPAYLAPEQARGRACAATDQWALAITAYELLAGRIPWIGQDATHVLAQILVDEAPALSTLRENVPAAADAVLLRALAKDPDERHAGVLDFANALAEAFNVPAPRAESDVPETMRATVSSGSESQSAQSSPGQGPWRWIFAGLVGLVLAGGATAAYFVAERPFPASTDASSAETTAGIEGTVAPGLWVVAVLPFSVAGPTDQSYVGAAMTRSIGAKLELLDVIRTVDPRVVLDRVGVDEVLPARGAQVARSLDATHFVIGDVVLAGDSLEVHVTLYDHEGERLLTVEQQGTSDELLVLADRIAARLMAERGDLPSADLNRVAATTTSVAAMRAYIEGEQAHANFDHMRAADAFGRAVAEDPEFALAYYRRSVAYSYIVDEVRQREALEEALARRDRLPPRILALVEASQRYEAGDYLGARRLYEAHVRSYPTEVEAWIHLSETHYHLGPVHGHPITNARESLERTLELEPRNLLMLDHLIGTAVFERDSARVVSLIERLPAEQRPRYDVVLALMRGEDPLEQSDGVEDAPGPLVALPGLEGHRLLGQGIVHSLPFLAGVPSLIRHDLANGRPAAAMGRLRGLSSSIEPLVVENLLPLILLPAFRASAPEVREVCETTPNVLTRPRPPSDSDPHRGLQALLQVYFAAACAHRLGDDEAAYRHVESLLASPAPDRLANIGPELAAAMRASIALGADDPEAALVELEGLPATHPMLRTFLSPILASVFPHYLRAEALIRLGRHDEALRWVVSMPHLLYAARALEPWALRRAGDIHAAGGRTDEARTSYERYLELRTDHEPVFADEVAEVNAALAAL